jgi:hypothetical protein
MSWQAAAWAKGVTHSADGTKKLKPSEKLALLLIADYYNDEERMAWPSIRRLADECVSSISTVYRSIATLEEYGLLQITERFNERGAQLSNAYTLPLIVQVTPIIVPPSAKRGCQNDRGGGCQNDRGEGVTGEGGRVSPVRRPTLYNKKGNSQMNHRGENPPLVAPEGFEEFDREFQGLDGYEPTPSFYRSLTEDFRVVATPAEARRIRSWLESSANKKGRRPSPQFILNWLRRNSNDVALTTRNGSGYNGRSGLSEADLTRYDISDNGLDYSNHDFV